MGWRNPPIPWTELERRLSGRPDPRPDGADGGDSPAWSHRRQPYEAPVDLRGRNALRGPRPGTQAVPYAELHCHSAFSFGDGASHPEELATEAARLGLEALALTDHDGFYGVVRFAEAAAAVGLPTVFGAELSLGLTDDPRGQPDPEGNHLVVLARGPGGLLPSGAGHHDRPARRSSEGAARLFAFGVGRCPRGAMAGAHRLS